MDNCKDIRNMLLKKLKDKWINIAKEKLEKSNKESIYFITKYGEEIHLSSTQIDISIFFPFIEIEKNCGLFIIQSKDIFNEIILMRLKQIDRIMKEVKESIIDLNVIEQIKELKILLGE